MSMRVTETFVSIQGEGHYSGAASMFVRLFGCNFTCAGFSRKERVEGKPPELAAPYMSESVSGDTLVGASDIDDLYKVLSANQSANIQDPAELTSIDELNGDQFTVGCDSRYSWDPAYKHLSKPMSPHDLFLQMKKQVEGTPVNHIVFTGGEPLMHQVSLVNLLRFLKVDTTFQHITFETNCSQLLTPALSAALSEWCLWNDMRTILFSNSPKLAHSGEPVEKRIVPSAFLGQAMLRSYVNAKRPGAVIQTAKYVLDATDEQFEEAKLIHHLLAQQDPRKVSWERVSTIYPAYAMPLGATVEQYRERSRAVADMCVKHGLRYCPRVHLDLYGNAIGT